MTVQPLDAPVDAPQDLADVIEHIGSNDMLMYSSDYPHEHASDPEALLGLLAPAVREQVLAANASTFYGLGSRAKN